MKAQHFLLAAIVLGLASQASALVLSGSTYAQAGCLHAEPMRFNLLNDSESAQSIALSALGESSSWVQFAQPSIALGAGQSTEVIAFVKPDCGAGDGNYHVQVYAGDLQIATLTIDVKSARGVSVSVAPISIEAKQCQSAAYNITVLNSGQLEENVLVSVSGIPEEWLSFSRTSVILGEGGQKQMQLTVQVPCNSRTGAIPAMVSVQYAGKTSSAAFLLNVLGMQSVSISLPEGFQACREEGAAMSGKITNSSNIGDSIMLSVPGAEWAKPSPQNFSIAAGETRKFEIAVQKNNAEAKDYRLELNVKSLKFGSSQSKKFSAGLKACYALEVKEEYAPRKACIGEKTKFAFVLRNIGQKGIEGIVSLSGAGISIPQKKELIKAGDSRLEEFWLDFNKEKAGKKVLAFGVSSQYYSVDRNAEFVLEDCNKGAVAAGTAKKQVSGAPLAGLVAGIQKIELKTIASIALGVIIVALLVFLAVERKKIQKRDLGGIAREIKHGSGNYPDFLTKERTIRKGAKKKKT